MCPQMNDNVQALIREIETHDRLTPSLCKKLLQESSITPDDLMAWADFDHPKADSYGRKLIHNGGYFELMAMSWVDGDMAAIHDHGYTQWGAVKLFGPAEHAIFRLQDGKLTTAERKVFSSGDVVAVGHEFIHQMGNVGQDNYLTLHLYGCYERDCDVTADANLYDLYENSIRITSGGVFFDLPEEAVDRREPGPQADFPTTLRDRVEMLKRMQRAAASLEAGAPQSSKEQALIDWLFAADTWQGAENELVQRSGDEGLDCSRYAAILHQELSAAAQLQSRLIDAGLANGPLATAGQSLNAALEASDLASFADRYLDLLGETFTLDFPVAQAA